MVLLTDIIDRRLRMALGRQSAKDEDLLKEMQDLQEHIAKSCFGIEKLETRLEDIRVLSIYQMAQQKMAEYFEEKASTMTMQEFLPLSRTVLFNIEREMLKNFGRDIAKEDKRKQQYENNELSDEEKMKPYSTWIKEIQVEESEIQHKLDKPEDWITFRFILNDLLFRHG